MASLEIPDGCGGFNGTISNWTSPINGGFNGKLIEYQ